MISPASMAVSMSMLIWHVPGQTSTLQRSCWQLWCFTKFGSRFEVLSTQFSWSVLALSSSSGWWQPLGKQTHLWKIWLQSDETSFHRLTCRHVTFAVALLAWVDLTLIHRFVCCSSDENCGFVLHVFFSLSKRRDWLIVLSRAHDSVRQCVFTCVPPCPQLLACVP